MDADVCVTKDVLCTSNTIHNAKSQRNIRRNSVVQIKDLLKTPFFKRPEEEKRAIISCGKPQSSINLSKLEKTSTDTTKKSIYSTYTWLIACVETKKLYCWPCLLFCKAHIVWCSDSACVVSDDLHKHALRTSHMNCVLQLMNWEERVKTTIKEGDCMVVTFDDTQDKGNQNLDIVRKTVDVIFMLLTHENTSLVNSGSIQHILDYYLNNDPSLTARLNSVSNNKLLAIQKNILQTISDAIIDQIANEISKSYYVAVMVDQLCDSSGKLRTSIILRYVYNDIVYERFVGFADMKQYSDTSKGLTNIFNQLLTRYKLTDKIVSQTYDGSSSFEPEFTEFQKKFRTKNKYATVVPCYAHILTDVLSDSVMHIRDCQVFFSTIKEIIEFEVQINEIRMTVTHYVDNQATSMAKPTWNFESCAVCNINTHRSLLIDFFGKVIETDNIQVQQRILAIGCLKFLKQFRTVFLLNLFSTIFSDCNHLLEFLPGRSTEVINVNEKVKNLLVNLEKFKTSGFNLVWDLVNESFPLKNKTKSSCFGLYAGNDEKQSCELLFHQITEIVYYQMQVRFSFLDNYTFFNIVDGDKLNVNNKRVVVPKELFKSLKVCYSGLLDVVALENEVNVLYNNDKYGRMRNLSPLDKMKWLTKKNAASYFESLYKLCALVVTIPITCESDCIPLSESTLKKVKDYFCNTTVDSRLQDSYSILCIEKDLLNKVQNSKTFYNRVIGKSMCTF